MNLAMGLLLQSVRGEDVPSGRRPSDGDAVKCAVLTQHAPDQHVKTYLLLNAAVDIDFDRLCM
eukprot:5321492-Amphidinium_carterae.1